MSQTDEVRWEMLGGTCTAQRAPFGVSLTHLAHSTLSPMMESDGGAPSVVVSPMIGPLEKCLTAPCPCHLACTAGALAAKCAPRGLKRWLRPSKGQGRGGFVPREDDFQQNISGAF